MDLITIKLNFLFHNTIKNDSRESIIPPVILSLFIVHVYFAPPIA